MIHGRLCKLIGQSKERIITPMHAVCNISSDAWSN
jgi:hypothetical protein